MFPSRDIGLSSVKCFGIDQCTALTLVGLANVGFKPKTDRDMLSLEVAERIIV